jgi:putative chitinase
MIKITEQHIKKLAPNAKTNYREAFKNADTILAKYQINNNALRVAHFMAQILHETGDFTIYVESMNYSAKRIVQVWPSRFPHIAAAEPYAHNGKALANKVYNGRMGNREGTDDGWNYIGHGLMQITGREDYLKYGKLLGIDLAGSPELAIDPRYTLMLAAVEWNAKGCNALADEDGIIRITKKINGGLIGIADRKEKLAKTKNIWS